MTDFWLGVLATIGMEILIVALSIVVAFVKNCKKVIKEDKENND